MKLAPIKPRTPWDDLVRECAKNVYLGGDRDAAAVVSECVLHRLCNLIDMPPEKLVELWQDAQTVR